MYYIPDGMGYKRFDRATRNIVYPRFVTESKSFIGEIGCFGERSVKMEEESCCTIVCEVGQVRTCRKLTDGKSLPSQQLPESRSHAM